MSFLILVMVMIMIFIHLSMHLPRSPSYCAEKRKSDKGPKPTLFRFAANISPLTLFDLYSVLARCLIVRALESRRWGWHEQSVAGLTCSTTRHQSRMSVVVAEIRPVHLKGKGKERERGSSLDVHGRR